MTNPVGDNPRLLCQDCSRPLFRWFLSRIDWRRILREMPRRAASTDDGQAEGENPPPTTPRPAPPPIPHAPAASAGVHVGTFSPGVEEGGND